MPRFITTVMQALTERSRARRRRRNLSAGTMRKPARAEPQRKGEASPARVGQAAAITARKPLAMTQSRWIGVAGALSALVGGAIIAGHARHLGAATISTAQASEQVHAAAAYGAVLPGVAFSVPARPGLELRVVPGGALLVAAGMQAAPPVRVDLCSQLREAGKPRLVPLRLGYRFEDVQRWLAHGAGAAEQGTLRNVLLVDATSATEAMPEVQISGMARADFADPLSEPLQLSWRSAQGKARWISDASFGQVEEGAGAQVALRQQGWLLWGTAALRIERRANAMCPQAGDLLVQMYHLPSAMPAGGLHALVTAFPARGRAVSSSLAPGQYLVPSAPRAALEDQTLFQDLQAHGLVRLNANGAIDTVPRDLAMWSAAADTGRAAPLPGWSDVQLDHAAVKLIKRLYYEADGDYVRQQIDIYNSELRLLAWRVRSGPQWNASVDGGPVAATTQMPGAAARLFDAVPQGWQPWMRVAHWPQTSAPPIVHLTLDLPRPAVGGETMQLMLIGRAANASGAHLQLHAACTGRACAAEDDAQLVSLELQAGARSVRLDVQALAMQAPEDQKYRHLRVDGGKLVWQALGNGGLPSSVRAQAQSPVLLQDRTGTLLWADGAPTQPALDAGLAPMLGFSADHASSVAGMLARLPSASGAAVTARMTLDLPLQTLSQKVLECVGMRRGHWDGKVCAGGSDAPDGRHAGMVILDTETGDVLVAAGAGAGAVNSANWSEVRDFDRADPARSPLRLPALQHDGGAHQSPGSTFKVISALGLELAAANDAQIDSLLSGMPLAAINHLAQQRGYGFHTDAATYPTNPHLAHITNYKEQSLDRRAQEGRLGLAQALTYSLNTWFAWSSEMSDRSLFGRPDGGAPDLQALDANALDSVRPIVAAAHRLGFEQSLRLDGGLLPADFNWSTWDALQATPAHIDPIHTRHELRQMAIGLRMQVTPLQMAIAAAAVGQGKVVAPRLLLTLDGSDSVVPAMPDIGIRLDRIRAGMKGVVDVGTAANAFGGKALAPLRPKLYGKTGTAPTGDDSATVWFTGWLEPGSLPGQTHRLAVAAFVSHSEASGGDHAAPVVAAVLSTLLLQDSVRKPEQKGI